MFYLYINIDTTTRPSGGWLVKSISHRLTPVNPYLRKSEKISSHRVRLGGGEKVRGWLQLGRGRVKTGQNRQGHGQNRTRSKPSILLVLAAYYMDKNEKTFSHNQKICHKYIWQKLECKKVVSKFEGVDFYRKFYENSTPTAYSLRVSTPGGRSGMPCAALYGIDWKAAKPFEMAAYSSCNALHVVDIGRICKACTAQFWANLHRSSGIACTGRLVLHGLGSLALVLAAWIRCVVPYWAALHCMVASPSTVGALIACGIDRRAWLRVGDG